LLWIINGKEDINNGAYGSRSHGENRLDRDNMIKDGKLLDILDRRGDRNMFYSNFGYD